MNFSPIHHFVHIAKVTLKELKTAGGIHLPDNLSEKAAVFQVLAAGPGFFDVVSGKRVPMSVAVGDLVLIDVNQVINASYSGSECLICPETAVFGTVKFDGPKLTLAK